MSLLLTVISYLLFALENNSEILVIWYAAWNNINTTMYKNRYAGYDAGLGSQTIYIQYIWYDPLLCNITLLVRDNRFDLLLLNVLKLSIHMIASWFVI